MSSSFSERLSRRFSLRSSKRPSSIYDSKTSIYSGTSTLVSEEFPDPKFPSRIEMIEENDVLDSEDQAWGSPPPFKWSLPIFSRKTKSRS